jgi:hypothetical protein
VVDVPGEALGERGDGLLMDDGVAEGSGLEVAEVGGDRGGRVGWGSGWPLVRWRGGLSYIGEACVVSCLRVDGDPACR